MKLPDFKKLFESAAGLYVVVDRDLRIVAASDAYLRATRTEREAIVGRSLFDAFPENPRAEESAHAIAREMYGRVFAGEGRQSLGLKRYDVPLPVGGFEERYWDAVTTPLRGTDGSVEYAISTLHDVTATEERYRTLFQSIDAGFCVIEMLYDAEGRPADYRFLEVNPAFERQTGLRDAAGRTVRELFPQHEKRWFEIYGRVARTREPVRFVEPAALIRGWYEVYAYPVGAPHENRVAVLFNDITERVRAEEALRDAGRRKDEFLATLAHELRNPLAPIRNGLAIVRLKAPGDPDLRMAREMMERQVAHMVRLVDDLLDVSRITFGKVELRREPLDLRAVAEEAVAAGKGMLDEAGHRLTVRLGPEPLWADGDRVRLAQVAANLLGNAARYTRRGGEILLSVDRAGERASLCVQDDGMGIAPEMLESIFEAFAQGGAPGAGGGIGIGLTLSRKLVELHGGSIVAESEGAGRGSRFLVHLPLVEHVPAPAEAPRAPQGAGRHRFLVVDDNADAAQSQARLLRMLGHEAETASDGEDALRKAARFQPQVVLLDIGMPGMDGFEVARRLRALPEGRAATLIAQTGFGQPEDRLRSADAGFDAHLAKPADLEAILAIAARGRLAR